MISVMKKFCLAKFGAQKHVEIQDILNPIILIASVFGLLPHSVKFSKIKKNYKIIPKSIYLNCLFMCIILLLISTFLVFHIRYVYLLESPSDDQTKKISTKLNYSVELVNFVVVCSTAYLYAFLNRLKYVKILNTIASIWANISSSHKSRIILKKLRFQRNLVLLCLVIIFAIQMYLNTGGQYSLWRKTLLACSFNLPQLIQFSFHAFYTMLVMSTSAILCSVVYDCETLTNDKYRPSFSDIEVKPKIKKVTLRQMELVYMKAFEIKSDINDAFKGPLLASILQSFHALVSEAHIIYYGVLFDKSITIYGILDCSIWIVCQLLKIYTLSYSGNLIKFEALKIGQALHYIPTEKQDLRLLLEIQHFTTLLKYQSVELDVFGYFSLDAKFMFNLLASATMYLIILVQFDQLK